MEFKKVLGYNINIEPTMNGGFYVKIGKARFAFGNVDDLIETVRHYLENPGEYEKNFYKNKVEAPEGLFERPLTHGTCAPRYNDLDEAQCVEAAG